MFVNKKYQHGVAELLLLGGAVAGLAMVLMLKMIMMLMNMLNMWSGRGPGDEMEKMENERRTIVGGE